MFRDEYWEMASLMGRSNDLKDIVLKADNISKSFNMGNAEHNVLRDINLEICSGDYTVIMGSSGSGKSTLLYSLSGMDQPTSGEVTILGQKINKMKEKELDYLRREKISIIFQGIHLIPELSVYENIAAPTYKLKRNKSELKAKILSLLQEMELTDHIDKYPSQLSGGQKQRVAICRSLINNPHIIFGDEPTGALNSSQGQEVLDILTKLNRNGQTIVLVTHDVKVAVRGMKLLYIKDGIIHDEMELDQYQDEDYEERLKEVNKFLEEQGW